MNVLLIYHSRTGNTQKAADGIADILRKKQHQVTMKSVIEIRKTDIESADVIFVGTWVHGFILFGVRPAGADLWIPALPSLMGKPVGIFCTYAFNPRRALTTLATMLRERGGNIVAQHKFHRSRLTEGNDAFVNEVLQAAERTPA